MLMKHVRESRCTTWIKRNRAWELLPIYGWVEVTMEGGSEQCYVRVYPPIKGKVSMSQVSHSYMIGERKEKVLKNHNTAAHLTLALYIHNNVQSQFIPNVLFIDIGIMIKNVFFCITKAKADHPMQPFFIVLLDTDWLKTHFGILHTMVGNDANLDVLQLALHVTATTEVSNILAKHPEWDNGPC